MLNPRVLMRKDSHVVKINNSMSITIIIPNESLNCEGYFKRIPEDAEWIGDDVTSVKHTIHFARDIVKNEADSNKIFVSNNPFFIREIDNAIMLGSLLSEYGINSREFDRFVSNNKSNVDLEVSISHKEVKVFNYYLLEQRLEEVPVTRTGIDYEKLCYAKDIDIQSKILDSLNHALAY